MSAIIKLEGVSKKYSRNADKHRGQAFGDLMREMTGLGGGATARNKLRKGEFWAAKDINFEVKPGEAIALIGRNGCGKTTTLKMLAGLIKPDTGRIEITGRVQALIALGTGFNPKLSGHENIYNAAAVEGFSAKATRAIINEIIDFAEIGEFMDAPVGTYSSGMKARLGFAAAVHMRPDILFVDEILGVGDFAFQNKCFTKLTSMLKNGLTLILVSHSHNRVVQMCDRALWLDKGVVQTLGPARKTVDAYLNHLHELEAEKNLADTQGNNLETIDVTDSQYGPLCHTGEVKNIAFNIHPHELNETYATHEQLSFQARFTLTRQVEKAAATLLIYKKDGTLLTACSTLRDAASSALPAGPTTLNIATESFNPNPGSYVAVLVIMEGKSFLYRNIVQHFTVRTAGQRTWGLVDFNYTLQLKPENTETPA